MGTNKTHTVSPSGFLPQLSHTQPLIDSTNLPPQLQSIKSPIHLKRPVDQLISLGSTYSSQSSLSQCQACLGPVFSSSPHLLQCPLGMFKELLSLIYLSFLLVYLLIENERMDGCWKGSPFQSRVFYGRIPDIFSARKTDIPLIRPFIHDKRYS